MSVLGSQTISQDSVKLRWKEPFITKGVNQKDFGVVPKGIYRGFDVKQTVIPSASIRLEVDPGTGDSIAVLEDQNDDVTTTLVVTSDLQVTTTSIFPIPGGGSPQVDPIPPATGQLKITSLAGMTVQMIGQELILTGFLTPGFNGTFTITNVPSATEAWITNATAAASETGGTYSVRYTLYAVLDVDYRLAVNTTAEAKIVDAAELLSKPHLLRCGRIVVTNADSAFTASVIEKIGVTDAPDPEVTDRPWASLDGHGLLYPEALERIGNVEDGKLARDGSQTMQGDIIPEPTDALNLGSALVRWSRGFLNRIKLGDGLLGTLANALLPRIEAEGASSGTSSHTLLGQFKLNTTPPVYVRTYLDSFANIVFTVNAYSNGAGFWAKDDIGRHSSKFSISDEKIVIYGRASGAGTWDDNIIGASGWVRNPFFASLTGNNVQLKAQTVLGGLLLDSAANALLPRIAAPFYKAGVGRTGLFQSDPATGASNQRMRTYRATNATFGESDAFELLFNAEWNGTKWVKLDGPGSPSMKIQITHNLIYFFWRAAVAGDWDDTATGSPTDWYHRGTYNLATGNQYTIGHYHAGTDILADSKVDAGSGVTSPSTPRYIARIDVGTTRTLVKEVRGTGDFIYRFYAGKIGSSYVKEDTFNCYWDGANWNADNPLGPAAVVYRLSNNEQIAYKKTTTLGTPWAESAWDEASGDALSTVVGTIPPTPSFYPNVAYPDRQVLAWGRVLTDGTGGAALVRGMNVSFVGMVANNISVFMVVPSTGTHDYAVGATYSHFPLVVTQSTASSFLISSTGENLATVSRYVNFWVFGVA
jgi:hypothetical protein